MFYKSTEIDNELSCSYCEEAFDGAIKLLPDCGESICGDCYESLLDELSKARRFKCLACGKTHTMPKSGLTDNQSLGRIRKRMKVGRPLSQPMRALRTQIAEAQDQLSSIRAFDPGQRVRFHCGHLSRRVSEAVEGAVRQLRDVEKARLKEIGDYERTRFGSLSSRSSRAVSELKQELKELARELDAFGKKWSEEELLLARDGDIDAALGHIKRYQTRLETLRTRLQTGAIVGQKMTFEETPEDAESVGRRFRLVLQPANDRSGPNDRIHEGPLLTLTGHSGDINQVLFLPDDNVASCSDDKTIRVWSSKDGAVLGELKGHTQRIYSLCLLANGWLASGSQDGAIKIWDLDQQREIRTLRGHAHSVIALRVLKSDRLASYSTDDTIRLWNPFVDENQARATITGHGNEEWVIKLFGVMSSDNLVTCSRGPDEADECILRVWNPTDGKEVKSVATGMNEACSLLVLANDQVALGFECGTIRIIDTTDDSKSTTKERAHSDFVSALAQLAGGELLSSSIDQVGLFSSVRTINVWDLRDFSLLQTVQTDHKKSIDSLSISLDQKYLASGSRDDTIKLWLLKRPQSLLRAPGFAL